ncbi:MAG: hypothetical protein PHY02_00905 [Phycisphaerae bacterium]|nr:hypothetical protein [Phycisphaerae bacterium]
MKKLITICAVVILVLGSNAIGAGITGTSGTTTLHDRSYTTGLFFAVNVYYEAFDGLDANDPLGITPGKKQYAYILEYIEGNEYLSRLDVESTGGVPLLETGTSTNGTVNGVSPGTVPPIINVIIPLPSGNPAARFYYSPGLAGVGTKSVIMVYTASDTSDVGMVLAGVTDTGLSDAGEVIGPVPQPSCTFVLAGDMDDDCKVDFYDFAIMAENWLIDCQANPSDPACVPK